MSSRELLEEVLREWETEHLIPYDLKEKIRAELAKPEQEPKLLVDVFMYEGNKCFNTEWLCEYPQDWEFGKHFLYAEPLYRSNP